MNFPKTTDTREHPKGVGEVLLKSRMSFSPPIVQRESAPNVGQVQVMNPPDDLQSRSTLAKPVGNVVTLPDQMPFTVGEVFAAPRAAGSATVASSQTQIGAVPDARHVAQQVAAAVVRKGGGTTEIALKPAELGHVRLTLAAQDTAIVLSIQTERPEINDIMRRHIDVLAQEFRALGYSNVRFEFSGNSGDS